MAAKSNGLLKTGLIGSVIAAICCFTPVLIVMLGVVGLGAITGYLDYVLLPGLVVFVGITIYALVRKPYGSCEDACPPGHDSSK